MAATPEEAAIRQFLGKNGRQASGATDLARRIVRVFQNLDVKLVANKIREWFKDRIITKSGVLAPYTYMLA